MEEEVSVDKTVELNKMFDEDMFFELTGWPPASRR